MLRVSSFLFVLLFLSLCSHDADATTVSWPHVAFATDSGGGTLTGSGNSSWSHSGGYNDTFTIATTQGGNFCFSPLTTDGTVVAGLTNNYTTIGDYNHVDFAISTKTGCSGGTGHFCIYEAGAALGHNTAFSNGDVLCVVVSVANVVTYTQNGSLIYTSLATPTFPIYPNSSEYENGAITRTATFSGTVPILNIHQMFLVF